MFYQSQKMKLECIRVVKKGPVNDIYICQDLNTAARNLYTLLVIREHTAARRYLEVFEQAGMSAQDSYIDSFSDQGAMCMVFEYKQERPLETFYMGDSYTLVQSEEICTNLVLTCMTSNLPYPILYLILKQNQLNLSRDNSIYLGYQIDLSELDETKTERDCAVKCAMIIRSLLETKTSQKAFSYRLLEKKIARRSYSNFRELYKDIRITASPGKKKGIRKRLKGWYLRNQDMIFRILLLVCVVLTIVALLSLLSQLFFGNVPWLRLFFNGFKIIGTESLAG